MHIIYSTWSIMICLVIPILSLLLFIQSLYSLSKLLYLLVFLKLGKDLYKRMPKDGCCRENLRPQSEDMVIKNYAHCNHFNAGDRMGSNYGLHRPLQTAKHCTLY